MWPGARDPRLGPQVRPLGRATHRIHLTSPPFHPTKGDTVAQDVLTDLHKVRNIGIMAHIDAGKTLSLIHI